MKFSFPPDSQERGRISITTRLRVYNFSILQDGEATFRFISSSGPSIDSGLFARKDQIDLPYRFPFSPRSEWVMNGDELPDCERTVKKPGLYDIPTDMNTKAIVEFLSPGVVIE